MKGVRKLLAKIVCVAMVLCVAVSIPVRAEVGIMPCYENDDSQNVVLQFESNKAICVVSVYGKNGTTKITGTLKLYDETDRKTIASWAIIANSSMCYESRTAYIVKGHRYKLTFSGKVYNQNGISETVSSSTIKKY